MKPESFFDIVQTPEIFEFRSLNLFKIFYVEYTNRILGQGQWAVKTRPALTAARGLRTLPAFFRAAGRALALRGGGKIFFYGASQRLSEMDGTTFDLYNPNIIAAHGRSRFILFQDHSDEPPKTYAPDLTYTEMLPLMAFCLLLVRLLMGAQVRRFAAQIAAAYPQLGFSAAQAGAMTAGFYARYLAFRWLLAFLRPARALLICHYSRESFTAAARSLGLEVTELMHGQINRTHAYYYLSPAYPASARSLYPDRLGVYGEYWRRILVERNFLPAKDIFVLGYYLKLPRPDSRAGVERRGEILFTTQHTVQEELVAYLAFLKAHLDRARWQVLVRPHPAEDPAAYEALAEPGFITVTNENTYTLLNQVEMHISAYSTVLYEAVRYPISNYALYTARAEERWKDVLESGVARPLMPDELPCPYPAAGESGEFYFAPYRPEALFGPAPSLSAR